MSSTRKLDNSGKPLPDLGLKWGKSPGNDATNEDISESTTTTTLSNSALTVPLKADGRPDWESVYTEDEKEKLKAKGINPALKAEMEASKKNAEAKGFWGKLAQTAIGGGVVK